MLKGTLTGFILLFFSFYFSQTDSSSFQTDSSSFQTDSSSFDFSKINEYKNRYKVNCLEEKITDNKGNGFEELYGTRNCRTILYGIAYRGGGNNYYHRSNKRDNKNPLPIDGLNSLLNNGFSKSVYLYKHNFKTAPPILVNDQTNDTLKYYQLGGDTESERDSILSFVYDAIMNKDVGPVYLHCWNGWHQSGYVSTVLLKQFCGFNNQQSIQYWEECADRMSRGYSRIRKAIRDFKPIEKYSISKQISDSICPCYHNKRQENIEEVAKKEITDASKDNLKSLKVSIKYPSNVSSLPPTVSTFLDEYAKMLKKKSFLTVEVGGHTDSKGSAEYNKLLSEKRAKNAMNYLIKQGVNPKQLKYKGYGEKNLKNKCADGIKCSASLHAINRRIEFKITQISHQINFENGSTKINNKDRDILNDIKSLLSTNQNMNIEIGGHADKGSGTEKANKEISLKRAQSVFNYFKENGLDMRNITYKGYGTSRQKYHDQRDRRIEFKIFESK